jgi:hypothetical protein
LLFGTQLNTRGKTQCAAYKKLATANKMNAVDSSAIRCVLPTPIVTQRGKSICHVIGLAIAASRNHGNPENL